MADRNRTAHPPASDFTSAARGGTACNSVPSSSCSARAMSQSDRRVSTSQMQAEISGHRAFRQVTFIRCAGSASWVFNWHQGIDRYLGPIV